MEASPLLSTAEEVAGERLQPSGLRFFLRPIRFGASASTGSANLES